MCDLILIFKLIMHREPFKRASTIVFIPVVAKLLIVVSEKDDCCTTYRRETFCKEPKVINKVNKVNELEGKKERHREDDSYYKLTGG